MDRIKARQQKYKKGKERMMSMTQESSDGQGGQKAPEDDDDDDDGSTPSIVGASCLISTRGIMLHPATYYSNYTA